MTIHRPGVREPNLANVAYPLATGRHGLCGLYIAAAAGFLLCRTCPGAGDVKPAFGEHEMPFMATTLPPRGKQNRSGFIAPSSAASWIILFRG